MRLLRNIKTQQYFAHGAWTTNPAQAQTFADIRSVTAACVQHNLEDVELVMQYDLERSEGWSADPPACNHQPRAVS